MAKLQRTESILSRTNLQRGVLVAGAISAGYFIPNQHVLFPTHTVLLTQIDRWIPLTPVWIWIYVSYYLYLVVPYFYSTGTPVQRPYIEACLLTVSVAFLTFIFFPTSISRDLYPWTGPTDASVRMLDWIRGADNSVNCMPSMHVAMSFVAAWAFTVLCGRWGRLVAWTLFLAICYSTMATKQHYFIDVVTGLGLGIVCTAIALKRHGMLNSDVSTNLASDRSVR